MGYLLLMLDVINCLPAALEKKRTLTRKVGVFMQDFSLKIFFFALLEALLSARTHARNRIGGVARLSHRYYIRI